MDIDRRQLLVGTVCSALTGAVGGRGVGPSLVEPDVSGVQGWHPLTRSLLERAQRIGRGRCAPDRAMVERTIRQFADASGCAEPPVIKWMDTPTDAFDHLSRFGLDALLDMGTTSFWRRSQPPASRDEETFDRAFEVRMMANELLGVDESRPDPHGSETACEVPSDVGEPVGQGSLPGQGRLVTDRLAGDFDGRRCGPSRFQRRAAPERRSVRRLGGDRSSVEDLRVV